MVAARFVPDAGDIVWFDFDPQVGRQQKGHRPALIITPRKYNFRAEMALMCPITSHRKGYPFELPLPEGMKISGAVLVDQLKSQDWTVRELRFIEQVPPGFLGQVRQQLALLLGIRS